MRPPRNARGFTLVELIVVIFVFSLFMLSLTQLIMGALRAYRKGETQTNLKTEARAAIDSITTDFRQSTDNLAQISPLWPSTSMASSLQMIRKDNSGNDQYITYTIDTSSCQLVRYNNSDGTRTLVADNVVHTDPRDGQVKSYFQWDSTSNGKTMVIQLYMVEDAKNIASTPKALRENFSLGTKISMRSTTTTTDPIGSIVTPSSLAFPGGIFHRNHP